jgi:predicted site-specific integrase-resolvase
MPVTIDGQTYYRTAEVYRMIGISRNTLYRWLPKGILGEVEFRDSRGWRLFTRDEIDKLSTAINRITRTNRYVRNRSGNARKSIKNK